MSFDLYAELAAQPGLPTGGSLPAGLASGFVDGCTSWSASGGNKRNEARQRYLDRASSDSLNLPGDLQLEPQLDSLPDSSWSAFEVDFTLQTPWYSRDDRPFHVLDNPLRKDHVFGVPYMPPASWKGLLRWACRMQAGLLDHLEQHDGTLNCWSDPSWIVYLFGNEKREQKYFQRGALTFYPTWFSRIGFEVINPHSRVTRAGRQPIYYEVVPAGAGGTLYLLYAPLPGAGARDKVGSGEAVGQLLDATEALLMTYGISAKRTASWGSASVDRWTARQKAQAPVQAPALGDFKAKLQPLFKTTETRDG